MPSTSRDRLIVFAKAAQPGAVKTRLTSRLGAAGAAALHRRLVAHTMDTAREAGTEFELCASSADDEFLRQCAQRHGARLTAQSAGDLGQRMQAAFQCALDKEQCGAAVLIGSDCPALTPRHLRLAFTALKDHDGVVAPAEDGGYVLIGLSRLDPGLFEGIEWGTDRVMAHTRRRLDALGWRWLELETLWDIDRPADYERLLASGLLTRSGAQPPP